MSNYPPSHELQQYRPPESPAALPVYLTPDAFGAALRVPGNNDICSDPKYLNGLLGYLENMEKIPPPGNPDNLLVVLSKINQRDSSWHKLPSDAPLLSAGELSRPRGTQYNSTSKGQVLEAGRVIVPVQIADFSGNLAANLAWSIITKQHQDPERRRSLPVRILKVLGSVIGKGIGGQMAEACGQDLASHVGRLFHGALYIEGISTK